MNNEPEAGTLGVHASGVIRQTIAERASALSMTRSRYAAMILEKWMAEGFPPVSPADEALQNLRILRVAETSEIPPHTKKTHPAEPKKHGPKPTDAYARMMAESELDEKAVPIHMSNPKASNKIARQKVHGALYPRVKKT